MNLAQYKDLFSGNTETLGALGGLLAVFAGFIIVIGLIALAVLIVKIIAQWKLFVKAGEAGWAAIVPFYNTFVLIKVAGLNWWYFLIAIAGNIFSLVGINNLNTLTSLLTMAVNFFIFYNLGKKFNKNVVGYGIGGALVGPIMMMILGFGKAEYNSSIEVSPNGPINSK